MFYKLALLFLLLITPTTIFAQTNDLSPQLENLGNPTKSRWADNTACVYARNVWDLQSYNNKLYIGSGNSSNDAPCSNAGPASIISFDPLSSAFTTEYTTSDEQVDTFRVLDFGGTQGVQLITPSHDPRSGNNLAFSALRNGVWRRHEATGTTAASSIHTYDLIVIGSKMIASGGYFAFSGNTADVNDNGGEPWTFMDTFNAYRGYKAFIVGGVAYVSGFFDTNSASSQLYAYSGSGASFSRLSLTFPTIFPSTQPTEVEMYGTARLAKIQRPVNYNSYLLYVGGAVINDHQSSPFGIYKVPEVSPAGGGNFNAVSRITLPDNAKPWDILVNNNKVYVLGSVQNGSRYWVTVSSSTDLTNWIEEFRFDAATFARSFELINNDWYFGLGTTTTGLSNNTGDILRIKNSSQPTASAQKTGDLDGNNQVDIFDYNILLTNFGKIGINTPGDIDQNGKIDIFDYNALLTNFGK